MADRGGKVEVVTDIIFLGPRIAADGDCPCEIKGHLLLGGKAVTYLDYVLKSRDHFADQGPSSQSYSFSSSHMDVRPGQKGRLPKNWCFLTVETTPESPLDCEEIKPVYVKGNQPWIFIGRTDAEVEAPMLWLSDSKSWLTGKDLDAGKNWRQEEKGGERMRCFHGITNSMDINLIKLRAIVHGVAKSQTWFSDSTTILKGWKATSTF